MKKAQAISIVIPVYNEEDHLEACLDSIAAQTVMPAEVIVVDNNSTDRSVEIARSYLFVRVVPEKKQGVFYARNKGFDSAKTTIIGRIDADTILPPGWVSRVQKFYDAPEHHAHALAGGCMFYNVRWPKVDYWITSQFVFRMNRLLVGHYILWGANMALPAEVWRTVRKDVCDRKDIHEDLDLAIHLHKRGYLVTYRSSIMAKAKMRRVFEDRAGLWANLKMWPQTLRVHGIWAWVFGYVGALFLFTMSWFPPFLEGVARLLGRKPLI